MVTINETITLFLGVGLLFFILASWKHFVLIPKHKLFLLAFLFLFGGWVFTVVEGWIWEPFFNDLEHICYMLSSAVFLLWCFIVFVKERVR